MTTVKYFSSAMGGVPAFNRNTAGAWFSVLDACLVYGFNQQTASSLVVSGEVATLTFPANYGWLADQVIEVAGASVPALNGQKRSIAASGNTLTFAAVGVPNQSATGVITCRTPPAGWAKPFYSGDDAVYRSHAVVSPKLYLRITNNVSNRAIYLLRSYESMTSASVGTGETGGGWNAYPAGGFSGDPTTWELYADDRTLYWWSSSPTFFSLAGFGDFESFDPADLYNSAIYACHNGTSVRLYRSRAANQITVGGEFDQQFSGNDSSLAFPNFSGGVLISGSVWCRETSPNLSLRGIMRGVRYVTGPVGNAMADGTVFDQIISGRRFVWKRCGYTSPAVGVGFLVDKYGPW